MGEKIDLMGSPPRVRGKAVDTVGEDRPQGITPACAGKSMLNRSAAVRFWDHPRVCGEKVRRAALLFSSWGSPPRVRGKDGFSVKLDNAQGITPACAGKSTFTATLKVRNRDHPRVCGEKRSSTRRCFSLLGSPPRVRGKDGGVFLFPREPRITPACAGKRSFQAAPRFTWRDHPRVCGEKMKVHRNITLHLGSPPRVRGKDMKASTKRAKNGITPACAGKRPGCCPLSRPNWDHPRVCGEKKLTDCANFRCIGSPPRVRGKVPLALCKFLLEGITPACAGKRLSPLWRVGLLQDHPRVCGEKAYYQTRICCKWGSPPRVRGKGEALALASSESRITPACAGKSKAD